MLKLAVVAVAVLVLIVLVVVIAGLCLPVGHTASRQAILQPGPAQVFAVLADVERYPAWRSDVKSVEVLSSAPLRWIEHGSNGNITFEQIECDAPLRIVSRIADPRLPFGGTWTYELAPSGGGTTLRITERGEVYNPVFRFMSRFVFGHTASIDRFIADLRGRGAS